MNNNNLDFLDLITLIGFIIGVANYAENVNQSDMQDAVQLAVDTINKHLEIQDEKLDKILEVIDNDKNKALHETD